MMELVMRQADLAAALVDPAQAIPPGLVSYRGDVDPKRFAVYRNNIHVGLVGVLSAKFPVCARLVGDDFFTAMARIYVADNKPVSPVMMQYGAGFPAFIAGFAAARTVPYLSDMARLEEAWSNAYNAQDAIPLSIGDLAGLDPDALSTLRLQRHPAATLVISPNPVGSIWSAHQAEGVAVRPDPEAVLVARPSLDVTVTVIPQADAGFLQHLYDGVAVGPAAAAALNDSDSFNFGRALVGLCALGAFSQSSSR